ncbi:MAG TPA: MFS transporter [Hyphomicrobiaceae bacterium]|jgi:MFS family permease|nr:MFS transporter [Hyphomicrobiaceae bacterium]
MESQARERVHFLLLNIGHFLDHLFTLIFATVAALALTREWGLGYADLLKYAAPGFFAFGVFALPAGWLADRWSREGMMGVFFVGIGVSAIATAFARTPLEIAVGLFVVGMFAAIYHPVGLAIVVQKWRNTGMRIAVNGVWGNLGVASAALITGYFIDHGGWRAAFIVPGVVSILIGIAYSAIMWPEIVAARLRPQAKAALPARRPADIRALLLRVSAIVFLTTAVSSIVFQSMSFALPKVFDERLGGLAVSATVLGQLTFMVFAVASIGQLIVGHYLDRLGPRTVFMTAAVIQVAFFAIMPGLADWAALLCAMVFMLAAFGQIPINDYLIGRLADGAHRARIYGVRYVVSFTVLAAALPLIAFVYENWGFDALFRVLAVSAAVILAAVAMLPRKLPASTAA